MKIIGHCGAKGLAPQNTLASFAKALEHHVDGIELDVQLTADKQLALMHDTHFPAAQDAILAVADTPLKKIQQCVPNVTTLDAALTFIHRRVPVTIEVKRGVPVEPIIKVINDFLSRGWQANDFRFASYDYKILKQLHQALPAVPIIVVENWFGVRATFRARRLDTRQLYMLDYTLWRGFIAGMAHRGYDIYCFLPNSALKRRRFARIGMHGHANNPRKARQWQKYGLAGVITDYPDRFEK